MNDDSFDYDRAYSRSLRQLDQQIAELRRMYDSMEAEERVEFRHWLAALAEVQAKCPYDWMLNIQATFGLFDEAGNEVDQLRADFAARTMLRAIAAWDKGEPYVPDNFIP